jgi:hypothetical protein
MTAGQIDSLARPEPGEYLPYFGQYIDLVPEGDVLTVLARQIESVCSALLAVDATRARTRPAASEWSPLDIAVHIADTERVLAFRAFTFARTSGAELPGVEFEQIAESACANDRRIPDVIAELRTVRAATLALFRSFDVDAWANTGVASGSIVSVRALAFIIAGHDLHHLPDFHRGTQAGVPSSTD